MIRKLLLSSVALASLSGAALAADLPSRMPPPMLPPPPIWSWSGFYVGINGGYGGDRFNYAVPGGLLATTSLTSSGFLGGGQIGYNWQFPASQFVIGVETDFQGSSIRADTSSFVPGFGAFGTGTKLDWFGTARGRLGYAFGQFMPYVTGGFAYGSVRNFAFDPTGVSNFSARGTHTGWTAGAGLEYAITHNLTFKTEYLYMDLGRTAYTDTGVAGTFTNGVKVTNHLVRAGLNYKFDWMNPISPVVAKY
jgi:outer membrane immunogenic protein